MIPLVDMHVHLLAGVDDGPRDDAEALEMCRLAYAEGTRTAAATAHQNDHYPAVTPERIRAAAGHLQGQLRQAGLDLAVFPCAEVMVHPDLEAAWREGKLLSVAGRGQYLLVEMPHGLFVDLRDTFQALCRAGVRPILAHPERHPELLLDGGRIEEFIRAGCLVQVSSGSVTAPKNRQEARALKDWFKRGIVHLLGSDGHSPRRRRPLLAEAYRCISRWVGSGTADRVCSTNGTAVAHGLPLRVPLPEPKRRWFARFW
jgi:protein-tyrosine phosphatase